MKRFFPTGLPGLCLTVCLATLLLWSVVAALGAQMKGQTGKDNTKSVTTRIGGTPTPTPTPPPSPSPTPPSDDNDRDGLSNDLEDEYGTGKEDPDSDDDNVPDGTDGWALCKNLSPRRLPETYAVVSMPSPSPSPRPQLHSNTTESPGGTAEDTPGGGDHEGPWKGELGSANGVIVSRKAEHEYAEKRELIITVDGGDQRLCEEGRGEATDAVTTDGKVVYVYDSVDNRKLDDLYGTAVLKFATKESGWKLATFVFSDAGSKKEDLRLPNYESLSQSLPPPPPGNWPGYNIPSSDHTSRMPSCVQFVGYALKSGDPKKLRLFRNGRVLDDSTANLPDGIKIADIADISDEGVISTYVGKTLVPLDIEFKNSKMTDWKLIPRKDVRAAVFAGDAVQFRAKLPSGVNIPQSSYSWEGVQTGTGDSITVTFSGAGQKELTLKFSGSPTRTVKIAVRDTPTGRGELGWAADHPITMISMLGPKAEALNWRPQATNHNNIGDAERHCYWNALMTAAVDAGAAEGLATAHEVSGLPGSHNESVMDLDNNATGRGLTTSGSGASAASLQTLVLSASSKGDLEYLDDIVNDQEKGLLKPTNQ